MTGTVTHLDTAEDILRLGNAFCEAKALLTAVQLDLFDTLDARPLTEEEIRDRLGLHGRGLADFLRLLVALGLLEADGGRYTGSPSARRHLVTGKPGYVGGFLRRTDHNRYPLWGRLADALRTGKPQYDGDFRQVLSTPAALEQFVQMMDGLTQVLAPQLADAHDWSTARSVVDVGGCRGNVAGHVVRANPGLTGHVFDLPQIEPFFARHVERMGLTGRISFHGGDFFEDDLPHGDVVVMGHVLHNWNESQRARLVAKAHQAVHPGGALLVYDRMLDGHSASPTENLVISLDMLLVSEGGAEYTVDELRRHAESAGFASVTARPLGDHDTLVVCRKD
ncbi:methyltransferase [Actinosynnema sp. CS-041913]|uniref:methyltransferase n=1 Tax=Actinosynnema sp. CS-041913 TaxID=3239917 RepID=UPI003D94CC8A